MRTLTAVLVASAVVVSSSACGHPQAPAQPPDDLTASSVPPDQRAGAFFLGDSDVHTCSGSVLHSTTGDLVLTAAHCVADGLDATFTPGLSADTEPSGAWQVNAVYLDSRWVSDQDPRADYAIVRVSRPDGARIESVVGSGLVLGKAPALGAVVTVTGYPVGDGDTPIGCQAATRMTDDGYPLLECDGMVAGTSGSPWVSGSTVTGVIGGLDGGGCEDDVSYSAPFDAQTAALLARAEAGGPGDVAPEEFDDDC